jgi:hypothetical protein
MVSAVLAQRDLVSAIRLRLNESFRCHHPAFHLLNAEIITETVQVSRKRQTAGAHEQIRHHVFKEGDCIPSAHGLNPGVS